DWDGLTQLIHRYAQSLLAQGRAETLQEWLHGIPPRVFTEQPWLVFWRGMGWWMARRHAACQRDFEEAFTAFRRQGDTFGMFLVWVGAIFAYLSEGELVPMDPWIARFDEIMPEPPQFPSRSIETRVAGAMLVALTWRQPHHPEAPP